MIRDGTIDILRGLAIFAMIASNSASYLLAEPHPFGLRLYGSFAAPMFILLSGFMVAYSTEQKNLEFKYFFTRGLIIIGIGAFIDIAIFKSYPFTSFDVLYTIGLSLPVAYLFLKISNKWNRWGLVLAIFALTPLLQKLLGYTDYPTIITFPFNIPVVPDYPTNIANHLLIDGWFPLFPWLGFSLLEQVYLI